MYHEVARAVDPRFARYSVTTAVFTRHLRYLALAGYTPVALDAALDGQRPAPRRRRPVVLTFDDGFRSCIDEAAPLLAARRYPATFFIVAGLVGRTSAWIVPEMGVELPLADWPSLRALPARGFACGAHSLSHPRLPAVPAARAAEEIRAAKAMLEDELGGPIEHFAYPFGAHDEQVKALVAAAGYRSACTTVPGLVSPDDDRLALRRVPVYGHESLLDFACRLRTGLPFRLWARSRPREAGRRRG
jgi:peptidoglycan/xylan/chitin deacetylase (PgdA/CDA1 family)